MTPEERASWKKDWAARLARPTRAVPQSIFHHHTEECGPEEVRMYGATPDFQVPAVYRKCREYGNPIRWADR